MLFKSLINSPQWQQMQEQFSEQHEVSLIAVGLDGEELLSKGVEPLVKKIIKDKIKLKNNVLSICDQNFNLKDYHHKFSLHFMLFFFFHLNL